jgi:hypothetical protein
MAQLSDAFQPIMLDVLASAGRHRNFFSRLKMDPGS